MTTLHDDRPHPVPLLAQLRYKENYFFVIVAPESGVFGMAHFSHEPGFDRVRYSCNLSVNGQLLTYSNITPFPADFEGAMQIGDGRQRVTFVEPHGEFRLQLDSDDVLADITFTAKHETFDFSTCRASAPENPTFQEVMTLGLNLPYNHQQQALHTTGTVRLKGSGQTVDIAGYGYRDHSWCMRSDGIVRMSAWSGLNFPSRAFGIKLIETQHRPGLLAKEGYTVTDGRPVALRSIELEKVGMTDAGVPDKVIHRATDVLGQTFTIESDTGNRLAHVSLESEAPNLKGVLWSVTENFCRSTLLETGETGYSLVELGETVERG